VWLPGQAVLFGGCFMRARAATSLGFIGDADLAAWPRSLESTRAAFPAVRVIVPGHGQPGGPELFDHTLELLRRHSAIGGG
jgi:metallo-beta-lactamase class B